MTNIDDFPDESQDDFLQLAQSHQYVARLEQKVEKLRESHIDRMFAQEDREQSAILSTSLSSQISENVEMVARCTVRDEEIDDENLKENLNLLSKNEEEENEENEEEEEQLITKNEEESLSSNENENMNDEEENEENEEEQFVSKNVSNLLMGRGIGMTKRFYDVESGELIIPASAPSNEVEKMEKRMKRVNITNKSDDENDEHDGNDDTEDLRENESDESSSSEEEEEEEEDDGYVNEEFGEFKDEDDENEENDEEGEMMEDEENENEENIAFECDFENQQFDNNE